MTMIEKVAQAITNELARQDGMEGATWPLEDGLKLAYLDRGEVDMGLVARAALTALLEPDDSMIDAGEQIMRGYEDMRSARAVNEAMITAALASQEA